MRCHAGVPGPADWVEPVVAQRSAARPEQIRRHNLGLLLRHLHQHGELTRSDLVEVTGLNRSTIAALVSELETRGMVSQQPATTTSRAGRPSYSVAPLGHSVYGLAIDMDVQRVTVAAVGFGGAMLDRHTWRHSGPESQPGPVVHRLVAEVAALRGRVGAGRCAGVGVGLPGIVRAADGHVLNAPNLQWRDVPFGAQLSQALGLSVRCANDGDLAALAEHQRGAGVGYDDLICVLGRVGVGSGVVSGGVPLRGAHGYAGEVGHMGLDASGPVCHCGRRGCLESYAGEEALLRAATDRGLPATSLPDLFAYARLGDDAALSALAEVAGRVGYGMQNLVNVLDPQLIVLTGHLSDLLTYTGSAVRDETYRAAVSDPRRPVRVVAGDLAEPTLTGAAELAFENLLTGDLEVTDSRQPAPA